MKTRNYAVSIMLIVSLSLFSFTPFIYRASAAKGSRRLKDLRTEQGAEVGQRIRKLRQSNANINAALTEFEKDTHSHRPKLDEASAIHAKFEETTTAPVARNSSVFRQASFRTQTITVTDTGVDVTLIPAVELQNEWQGTVIANFSDASGVVYETDVHNMVITRSPYDPSDWKARYDEIIQNGVPYLAVVPGMYTGFVLGVPILDHQTLFGAPPPQDIQEWQFGGDAALEQQYYNLYPAQRIYDLPPDQRGGIVPMLDPGSVSRIARRSPFQTTSFLLPQQRSDNDRRNPVYNNGGNISVSLTGGRGFASFAGYTCGGAALGCGGLSLFTAGVAFGPCASQGCAIGIATGALMNLRVVVKIY